LLFLVYLLNRDIENLKSKNIKSPQKPNPALLSTILECLEQLKSDTEIFKSSTPNSKPYKSALKNLDDIADALKICVSVNFDMKSPAEMHEKYNHDLQTAYNSQIIELQTKIHELEISKRRKSQQIAKYKEEVEKMRGHFSEMRLKFQNLEPKVFSQVKNI